jgi:hypothetical protein
VAGAGPEYRRLAAGASKINAAMLEKLALEAEILAELELSREKPDPAADREVNETL